MNNKDTGIKTQIYLLMDSFLTEAKDQNGNDRSLKRLNQDRHLFVKNCEEFIIQLLKQDRQDTIKIIEGMKKKPTSSDFSGTICPNHSYDEALQNVIDKLE